MSDKPNVDPVTGQQTTGHSWDGLTELNNPLPRWWLILLWATVIWAVIYMLMFPAFPLLERAWPGFLGYSSRANVEDDLIRVEASRAELKDQIASLSFDEIAADPVLYDYAQRSGASAFKIVCVQCHGAGAQGDQELGYPNLNDDAWLWGGTLDALHHTISHGIRNDVDPQARNSVMPAYGVMGLLDRGTISDVAHYVRSMSDLEHDEEAAGRGASVYAAQCAACHGADGGGNSLIGAPRLNDAIWLYGSTHEQVVAQIYEPRLGQMPPWEERFDDATLKKLAIYVHSLGGGE